MAVNLAAAIPPQPNTDESYRGMHLYACTSTGARVVYGTTTGVVVRCLPDQFSFKYPPVESFFSVRAPVICATMSSDNRTVVGGDSQGTVYVWKRSKAAVSQQIFKLHQMQYVKLADLSISPDSQRLAAVGIDRHSKTRWGAVILLDAGNAVGDIAGHTKGINSVHFRPLLKSQSIVTGGIDGILAIHKGPPYKFIKSVTAHVGGVRCVRFSPNGMNLSTCGVDGTIALWHPDELSLIKRINIEGKSEALSLAWSPDSSRIAVVTADNRLRVFNVSSATQETVVSVEQGLDSDIARGVCWTTTHWLLVVCFGGHIKGWQTCSGGGKPTALIEAEYDDHLKKLNLPDDEITAPNTPTSGVYTNKMTTPVKLAPLTLPNRPNFVWHGQKGSPTAIAFDRDSGNLAIGTSLGYMMFLSSVDSIPTAYQVSRLPLSNTVKGVIMGQNFACACTSEGTIRIYRLASRGKAVFQAGESRRQFLSALDVIGGQQQTKIPKDEMNMILMASAEMGERHTPVRLALFNDGKYIGVFCHDGTFVVYDCQAALQSTTATDIKIVWTTKFPGRILHVAVTPDGTLFALALYPNADYPLTKFGDEETELDITKPLIEIYEVDTAASLEGFRFISVHSHHSTEISGMAVNAEGSLLATADVDRNLMVMEVESQKFWITDQWKYHTTKITTLNWSPDGTKLVTGSTDSMIYVWDIDNPRKIISVPSGHTGGLTFARFLFNNLLATGGNDGNIKVFEVEY